MCSCYCCKQGQFDECVGELGDHVADDDLVNDKLDVLDEPIDPEVFTFIIEGPMLLYTVHQNLYNCFIC